MLLRRWTGSAAPELPKGSPDESAQRPRYLRRGRVAAVGAQQALDAVSIPKRIQELHHAGPHCVLSDPVLPAGARTGEALNRWRLRDELRPIQPRKLQRQCGVTPCGPVYVGAGWQRGLCTCHSVHSCPVCSARLRAARTEDVDHVVRWWREVEHGRVGMLTLTVRHDSGDVLSELRQGIAESWRALWQCRQGRELRQEICGYVRALDVTHGPNGWHPHQHNLILTDGDMSREWLERLRGLWCIVVRRTMGEKFVPRQDEVGVHYTANPPRSEYLLKLGLELTAIATKCADNGHRTVWDVAREAVDERKRQDISQHWRQVWREWSTGMVGARQLTWSRSLRKRAGLGLELDPEQMDLDLELRPEAPNDWIVAVHPEDWNGVFGQNFSRRFSKGRRPSALLRHSVNGLSKTLTYLDRCGLIEARRTPVVVAGKPMTLIAMRQRSVLDTLSRLRR